MNKNYLKLPIKCVDDKCEILNGKGTIVFERLTIMMKMIEIDTEFIQNKHM